MLFSQVFFAEGIALRDCPFSLQDGATIFTKLQNSKNLRKRFCAPLRIDSKDFNIITPQNFGAENVDVYLYNFFPQVAI